MAEFDVYEPLMAPPDMQSIVPGLQIVQQVRCFVDNDVTVWIFGFVGGPPHVRKVSCDAIACHLDSRWLETIISIYNPENPPRRSHKTGRQFCVHGRFGPLKVQHESPWDEFTEGDLLPDAMHKPLHHRINAPPNRFRSYLRDQLGFCRKQISQEVEQNPQGGFCRLAVGFVVLELGRSKTTGACSVPRLLAGAQESFDDQHR